MSFGDILQKFLTGPVELLLEVLFTMGNRLISDSGYLVIILGIIFGIASLILYYWADSFQNKPEDKKNNTGPAFLKKLEDFFFHKISFSFYLEILLFTSGCLFFRKLFLLHDVSFLSIKDLFKPDKLLSLGTIQISILPICVFVIRAITIFLQRNDTNCSNQILAWILTFVFSCALFFTPSAFALYWLAGEIIRLIFTILFKTGKARQIIAIVFSVTGLILMIYTLFFLSLDTSRKKLVIITALLMFQIPLLVIFLAPKRNSSAISGEIRPNHMLFLVNAVYMTILTGIQIPSGVIQSAPTDFISISAYYSPIWYVFCAFLLAAGTFIFWFGMVYKIAPHPVQGIISMGLTILSCWSTINSMFFGNNHGLMDNELKYEIMSDDPSKTILINFGILALIALILIFIKAKKPAILTLFVLVLCVTKTTASISNITGIISTLSAEKELLNQVQNKPVIPLSKTGKNVIVFMLDRSMGFYIPFLMTENPELQKQFDGFTFYPNTVSLGSQTNEAAPALFGGYEYTPSMINSRDDVPLSTKHNEALRLLPILFNDAGYEVTVIDPPYGNYKALSDPQIFPDYPEIHAYKAKGLFLTSETSMKSNIDLLNRNFFCYSIYRSAPLFIQPTLYASGTYNQVTIIQDVVSLYTAEGVRKNFEMSYNVLLNLPEITEFLDEDINTYLAIDNETTHEPVLLQLPDYTPAETVNNYGYESSPITRTSWNGETVQLDNVIKLTHYHSNMAAYMLLGEWLDYLKENGVYDNTRIIVAADHGKVQGYTEMRLFNNKYEEILSFNPVLMVKDFGSKGFSVDEQFMTNADVPSIALEGLISDPVNPATGNPVTNSDKTESDILIKHTEVWDIRKNNGNTFLPGNWYRFSGEDIFDLDNWELLGRY